MTPGVSADIAKAVIEVFAHRFLADPGVVFLSESGNKVVARDDALARSIGLTIASDKNLPDIILVDAGPAHPLLVFVEVVATDGPINGARKRALLAIADGANFPGEHLAFVTAFLDRGAGVFRKTVGSLAWGSYAWFASEPERLVVFAERVGRIGGGRDRGQPTGEGPWHPDRPAVSGQRRIASGDGGRRPSYASALRRGADGGVAGELRRGRGASMPTSAT